MNRLDKIQGFLEEIKQYYGDINSMYQTLPDINKCLQGLLFAEVKDIQLWQDSLTKLLAATDKLRCSYENAGLGSVLPSPQEACDKANMVYEKLLSRQKYTLAINFVKSLRSRDAKTNERLEQLRQGLPTVDIEQVEDENILCSLDKYIYLQNAFVAQKKNERFAELLKVGASLDSELLYSLYETPEVFSTDIVPVHQEPVTKVVPIEPVLPKSEVVTNSTPVVPVKVEEQVAAKVKPEPVVVETSPKPVVTVAVQPKNEEHIQKEAKVEQIVPETEASQMVDIEQLKRAFANQDTAALEKTMPNKKEVSSYTINKFKIEAKGENDSAISWIYRLIDKYGYVSLESPDVPAELKEDIEVILGKHRKLGYLIRVEALSRCTYYYLAVKGSQAIKDSAFRTFVRLGKNNKRADIHSLRDFNDFNVTSYVQLRDSIRSIGIKADSYDEKETVYKSSYTFNYKSKAIAKPDVRVVGFTETNTTNFNLMKVRLDDIAENREIVIIAGINADVLLSVIKWIRNTIDWDKYKGQLYAYNAASQLFTDISFENEFTNFQDIYDKYLACLVEEDAASVEETNAVSEIAVASEKQEVVAAETTQEEAVTEKTEAATENADNDDVAIVVPEGILMSKEVVQSFAEKEPVITSSPDKEKKNSSTKEFKKVATQNKIHSTVFSMALNGYYVHPEIISGYAEMPLESCVYELDTLVNIGLLRKVAIEGEDPYYILSPKAERLCKAETIRSLLKVDNRKITHEEVYSSVSPLVAVNFLDGMRFLSKGVHYNNTVGKCCISPEGFIYVTKPNIRIANLACISGYFADNAKGFSVYAEQLDVAANNCLVNIFISASKEQGKALLSWWQARHSEIDMNTVGYKVVGDSRVYTADEEVSFNDFEAFINDILAKKEISLKEKPDKQKAQEQTVQQEAKQVKPDNKDNKFLATEPKKKPKENPVVVETVPEEIEPELENIVLTNPDRAGYLDNYSKMLVKGKTYAACAYLKVLGDKDKSFASLYKQLAYAAGDPMGACTYTSQVINEVFFSEDGCDNYLLVAASLRNFFYDFYCYDYYINQLMDMLKSNELVQDCHSLAILLQDISDFKKNFNSSIDRYADYHAAGNVDIDKELSNLRYYAFEQYNHYCVKFKEDIANKRFSEARKYVLEKDGPLGSFLQKVTDGDDSLETLNQMRSFLAETYIVDGAMIRKENIASNKIEAVIDTAWSKAAEKLNSVIKTSDLMSALRTKFFNQIYRLVTPLCDYIALNDEKIPVDNPEASQNYAKLRSRLLQNIWETRDYVTKAIENGENTAVVLLDTLKTLEACLDGTYKAGSEKYFYLGFLKTDNVLLNDNYLPYLNEVDESMPSMSVLRRIEKHVSTKELSLETRALQILETEDNYSSLKCILAYLESINPGYADKFSKDKSLKKSLGNAADELEIYREEFENDIELRQSYGQIDETEDNRKEKLLKSVDFWYEWAKESENYGFFHKVCEALLEKIEADAIPRGKQLQNRLEKFVSDNPDRLEDELVDEAIATVKERIRIKNYAAAEDLLNRLYSNDDALIPAKSVIETDYLQNFIRDYNACYQDVCNMRVNFKSLLAGRAPNNKDGKAANRLVENWMYQPEHCTIDRVKSLLTGLDFSVGSVVERNKIGNAKIFDVTLARPDDGRKVKHKHPIAAFGSMAENDPFRVAFIFGNYEADGLLDIFNSLGDAQHTMIFMDGALTMSARRTLARKTKEVTGKTFAVVDRVVLAYLHRNYRQASVQKMLMSVIIPFAFCQPYVVDSFVMTPEIFIGREEELKQIESPDGVNIVYGGRQLGKSAMLRMAVNDVDKNERGDRAVYVDIANLDYKAACRKVAMVLNEDGILDGDDYTDDWAELGHRLRLRLKSDQERIPYLLLLLDEADEFIRTAAAVNYSPLENLKDIQGIGVGRFKFVFAGLRDVIRFDRNQALSNNSVMTKLSKLTVKPFNVNEARMLLEQPLGYLGLRFAKDEETESLIASIFSATNYFPGLLQLYCANLVKALQKADYAGYDEIDTPPYEVSVEHIKKVLGGKELQNQIRDKFFITLQLGENEDKYYYIIAHLIALQHHRDAENSDVTPKMLLDLANEYAIKRIKDLDEQKVYALMEELCELNILHTSGEGYRFTRYSFYQMMGSVEHIENELLQFLED